MALDQYFNTITDKLQLLLKQQARLKKENDRLRNELQEWQSKEELYQTQASDLSQQIQILKLGAGEMNEKDQKDFEKKINQYIKELDKCISYLSQ